MEGFRSLRVYELAYELTLKVYAITKTLPDDERYGMVTQMRRASMGIALNIAEGYGRHRSPGEHTSFVRIAQGSANEMRVLMDMCKDLGYIEGQTHTEMYAHYIEVIKMLAGLQSNIQAKREAKAK